MLHHLITHLVGAAQVHQWRFRQAPGAISVPQGGIEVATLMFEFQEKGHMVDASHPVPDLLNRQVEIMRHLLDCVLHRMTQARLVDMRIALRQGPCVDRHRIDVLHEQRVGAEPRHILGHRPKMRHGAQPPHDPTDAQCVGNRLPQPVFARDVKIDDGRGAIAADLKCGDHEIGALQCAGAVGGCLHRGTGTHGLDHLPRDQGGFLQPHRVNIHKRDLRIRQAWKMQHVSHDILHENRGPCANKGKLRHRWYPYVLLVISPHRGSDPR